MEDMKIKVYARVNESNEIIQVNSSIFLTDVADWILIDEGCGDKYAHAQGNYFDKPIHDEKGRCSYKLVDGEVVEIADEDKSEIKIIEQVTLEERVDAMESALLELAMGGTIL